MRQRSFKLPDELDARLVAHAAELDRPVSWVVVQALESRFGRDPVSRLVEDGPGVVGTGAVRAVDARVEGVASEPRLGKGSFLRTAAPSARPHSATCKCAVCRPPKS